MMRMAIESMCVVCHGPVARRYRTEAYRTALACGQNCKGVWHRTLRQGEPLWGRYENLRMMHAYRRQLLCAQMWLAARVPGAALLLEVSA